MSSTKPFGTLFDQINYNSSEDLDNFLEKMTPDQGLYCILQAVRSAHYRNAFSMEESEVVSKAIRLITKDNPTANGSPNPEVYKSE